jgi:hypothetical protein
MSKEIDLEALSKGVVDVEVDRETAIMLEKAKWNTISDNPKQILVQRRKQRKAMFRIKKYMKLDRVDELSIELVALKELFDSQMKPNLAITWDKFTFTWDCHPRELTTIILKENWFTEGGAFDEIGRHAPTAFTEQEI